MRGAIIVFLVSLLASGSLITGAWYYDKQSQAKYNTEKRKFQNISNQYLAVDQEEQLVRQYYPDFVGLYNKGVLGQERRLNWIETLREAGTEIKLPSLKYQISTQVKYQPDYPHNAGSFMLYASTMKLNLDLLHEGDLRKLFERLDKEAEGIYNISKCTFRRAGSGQVNVENISKANIVSECDLRWFNIKKSDGSDINISS